MQTLQIFEDAGNNGFPKMILQNEQELIQIITFHLSQYMTSSKRCITLA